MSGADDFATAPGPAKKKFGEPQVTVDTSMQQVMIRPDFILQIKCWSFDAPMSSLSQNQCFMMGRNQITLSGGRIGHKPPLNIVHLGPFHQFMELTITEKLQQILMFLAPPL